MKSSLLSACLLCLLSSQVALCADDRAGHEFFEQKIRPLFVKHCYSCHSAEAKKLKGNLRLDTRSGTLSMLVPGKPDDSEIISRIREKDESLRMPPARPLSADEIADLEHWVKMGAPDPRGESLPALKGMDLWSIRPVQSPAVPKVKNSAGLKNPIDAFIQARLEEKGLTAASPASKRVLLRRATFDLIGLPPTLDEIENFLADDSANAFEKVVDRLLASPHYGERWGRHWLDVVRYSDTAGDNSDYPIPQMYRYRNWVIDAFNRDLPYNEFVRQQLAGDLLPYSNEADREAKIIATGYLANSRRFGSYEDRRYPWYLTYDDTIDNLGRAFLGLTTGCCRCHDHKFDPLSQADYYALYGFFSSTRYPWPGSELDKVQHDCIPLAPAKEIETLRKEREKTFAEHDAKIAKLEQEREAKTKELQAAAKIADKKTREARIASLNQSLTGLKGSIRKARNAKEAIGRSPTPFSTAYAVTEGTTAGNKRVGNAHVLLKGDPERIGPEVPRRFPTVLGGQMLPPDVKGSGRLQLANWLVDPKNPLTARVMVNRIWQHHFGTGIVASSGNFGMMGRPPTHPELLDWLTTKFIEFNWSIRSMHKLMMLSRTYQQSSQGAANIATLDPNNQWLSHYSRQRLDAESIRDAMLAVSGSLDRTPGGEHPFPPMKEWDFTQHKPFKAVYETNRRSVYLMTQRIQRHPFLALFDGADTNAGSPTRSTSTTSLQALYMMNDPFVHARAKELVNRLETTIHDDHARIVAVYQLLYGRLPSDGEVQDAMTFLQQVRSSSRHEEWESLAHALFLSNEFVYVE